MVRSLTPFLCLVLAACASATDGQDRRRGDGGLSLEWPDGGLERPDASGPLDSLSGTDLSLSGTDLSLSGTDFSLSGTDFSLSGTDLSLSGTDLSLSGTDLATSGGSGVVTGGPCVSGATGATAIRVRWVNAGGSAQVQYEKFGLPDTSPSRVSVAAMSFSYTPPFGDTGLGDGGLILEGSAFIDFEISTEGVGAVDVATLSMRGRSYSTGSSGSFSWQSHTGIGNTPTNFVANSWYEWYSYEIGGAIAPNDGAIRLRVKPGPSSGALVVNQMEICLIAR